MKIRSIQALRGPNVYSHQPTLAMELDLESMAGRETRELPGFADRLLHQLPGLAHHHCSRGRPGGFVERLHEGTYAGHVVEHTALELSEQAGIGVMRGKTLGLAPPRLYLVTVAFRSEAGMARVLEAAVDLVEAVLADRPFDTAGLIDEVRRLVVTTGLGPSTQAIVDAAERRGVPWQRVNGDSLVRLGHGRHVRYVQATLTDRTGLLATELAGDKHRTKAVLREAGLPVPVGAVVTTRDDAVAEASRLRLPVVVKPLDGNQGRGVSLDLHTPDQIRDAFDLAAVVSPRVIVEEMYRGDDYRVVVVGGRMIAAAQRIPAHVWGDGAHTIAQLIDRANHDPRRGDDHEKPLTRIKTDPLVISVLTRARRTLDDVPPAGEMVRLRESANLSTGGEARDVTDDVHPTIRRRCERTARLIGLDVCGIDLVLDDIRSPEPSGGIVEVNAAPGIRMHHFPSEGQARDVGGAIVDLLYPAGATGRIPIVSITGTNGKTTVTRLVGHVVSATGRIVGMATTDGIWIDGREVRRGDTTGPRSAALVLSEPTVDIAVLETARGGIVRSGLGYDWADVAVLTNIQADHLGQDGIETLDDLAHVKQLVAERVREGGTLVLNADDERLRAMAVAPRVRARRPRLVYVSLDPSNPCVVDHLEAGGTAFVVEGGWLEERTGTAVQPLVAIDAVPATLGGTAEFQVQNVATAAATCRACGVPADVLAPALAQFSLDRHSAGRLNVYRCGPGHLVVDYGHNPAALVALSRMVSRWYATRVTQVLAVPGDRHDSLIQDAARAVSRADRVIIREDGDTRGRARGEVAMLLRTALGACRPALPVRIILDEIEAVTTAIDEMQPGEVVVAVCERVRAVTDAVVARGARPVTSLEALLRPGTLSPRPAA